MTLSEAKREAVKRANETGGLYSVVVMDGAECGILGNNKDCEVVPFPAKGRIVMAHIGAGARLD